MKLLRTVPAALVLLLAASCQILQHAPGVVVASDPPGARVLIDGEDTGFVTPCNLGLPQAPKTLQLVLPGYQVAVIELHSGSTSEVVGWSEAMAGYNTWHFPLWLNLDDFTSPVKYTATTIPHRIFVPMRFAAN